MYSAATTDTSSVKRRSIKVIKTRLEDVVVGDIVNREPDAEMGWFVVDAISTLFNGHIQLADVTEQLTVSGTHNDMVGLQLVEEVELDDRGVLAPPAPAVISAPVAPLLTAPEQGESHATPEFAPATQQDADSASQNSAPPADSPIDAAAESAAAAEVATRMQTPAGVPTGVNLALVAELLEDLDVGDAPAITTASASPEAEAEVPAKVVMPEGAIAVFGDTLPETPSYKNPVVVPEGTQLPRRSRAA